MEPSFLKCLSWSQQNNCNCNCNCNSNSNCLAWRELYIRQGRTIFHFLWLFFSQMLWSPLKFTVKSLSKTLLFVPPESCPEAIPRDILKIGQSNYSKKLEQAAYLKKTSLCVRKDEESWIFVTVGQWNEMSKWRQPTVVSRFCVWGGKHTKRKKKTKQGICSCFVTGSKSKC